MPLEPHLDPQPGAEPLTALRIAVAPFRDARLPLSRQPVRPRLRWVPVGFALSGEYATGDPSFRGDVADHVRQEAIATLRHAGLFAAVDPIGPGQVVTGRERDWDWVLQGEIEELLGIQNRRLELNLMRLPFLRSRVETPVGIARVMYRILDPRGIVRFERRIETQLNGVGIDMSRAALDAVAMTSEQLAHALYREFVPPRAARAVPVQVLDGCGLGGKQVERLVEDASEVFEREVGLRLEPALRSWRPPEEAATLEAALEALRAFEPPRGGFLLALLPARQRPLRRGASGLAKQLGERAVVTCGSDVSLRTVTLIHEIGHLLGAVHVEDRSSIMYPVAEFDARFFDDWNRQILRVARDRTFGEPLDASLRARLRDLYERAGPAPEADLRAALDAVVR